MDLPVDRPESPPGEARQTSSPSEDELARQMIERIARRVDLESGVVPRQPDPETEPEPVAAVAKPEAAEPAEEPDHEVGPEAAEPAEEPDHEVVPQGSERSEEDVARELVERIAREVAEGKGG